ncbi:ring finger membrane protein-like protein [Leptotrombidium deliense]|uniref:Ring finger membrane protein-like protein n=1 Tax=Leptotrombidium deliense TaxID=299467 RepID=A0A443RYB5_9ACAR|nr:ring finger membrane protein-like protein [Leptotrombidium deliense]
MTEEKKCRICFIQENVELIAPCGCKGSIKYVHKECLKHWVMSSNRIRCDMCLKRYKGVYLREILPEWICLVFKI